MIDSLFFIEPTMLVRTAASKKAASANHFLKCTQIMTSGFPLMAVRLTMMIAILAIKLMMTMVWELVNKFDQVTLMI